MAGLDAIPLQGCDCVLTDMPCSGSGSWRRDPAGKWRLDAARLDALRRTQADILDRAAAFVKPGGRLVYCTCSLLPDEGEVQVEDALARHPGLVLDGDALRLPGADPAWIGPEGLRTRPDYWVSRGGIDGFFIACLRKPA